MLQKSINKQIDSRKGERELWTDLKQPAHVCLKPSILLLVLLALTADKQHVFNVNTRRVIRIKPQALCPLAGSVTQQYHQRRQLSLSCAVPCSALALSWRSYNPKMVVPSGPTTESEAGPRRHLFTGSLSAVERMLSWNVPWRDRTHIYKKICPKESAPMTVEARKSQDLKEAQTSG